MRPTRLEWGNMAGDLEITTTMSDALVVLGAAGIIIPAFARARITPVIGFILVGVLVGPFGLGRLVGQFPRSTTSRSPSPRRLLRLPNSA